MAVAENRRRLRFADILSKDDLPVEDVYIPQWDGIIGVRTLRADERSDLEKQFAKKKPSDDPGGFRRGLLKATLVNDDRSPFLPDEDSALAFMKKNADAVEVLFEKACQINGFRQKDVEQLAKN